MDATPIAMQMKKNNKRRQEARISRSAIRRTNVMATPPREHRASFRPSAIAVSLPAQRARHRG